MRIDKGSEEVKLEQRADNSEQPKTPEPAASHMGNVRALVKRELKRSWPSYLSSGLLHFLFGLVGVSFTFTLWAAVGPGASAGIDRGVSVVVDLLFALLLANLSANFTSTRYFVVQRDPFSEHVEFLRTLPITPLEAVAGRAVVMLISTVAMAGVFFLPLYAFARNALGESPGFSTYLSFAGVWVAYGLVSGGIILYLELGLSGGRLRFWCFMAWLTILAVAVLLCNLMLSVHLVAGSLTLVERYGALPALISLAAGLVGFALLGAATARSIKRRSVKS